MLPLHPALEGVSLPELSGEKGAGEITGPPKYKAEKGSSGPRLQEEEKEEGGLPQRYPTGSSPPPEQRSTAAAALAFRPQASIRHSAGMETGRGCSLRPTGRRETGWRPQTKSCCLVSLPDLGD